MPNRVPPVPLVVLIPGLLASLAGSTIAQTLQPHSMLIGPAVEESAPETPKSKRVLAVLTRPTGPNGTSIAAFMSKPASSTPDAKEDLPAIFAGLVRHLRGDPTAVIAELRALGDRYDLITAAAQNGNATAQRALLSSLVLDRPSSDELVDSIKALDGAAGDEVISDMNEARRLISGYTGDLVTAALLAQGAVRSGVSGPSDAGTAGTGSIGLSLAKRDWQLTGLVAVASSVDTLRSGFGSFLLTPASGKGSLSTFLVDLHTPQIARIWQKQQISPLWPGMHLYVAGANSTWERQVLTPDTDDPTVIDTTRSGKQAAVLGVGALLRWRVLRGRLLNVPVQIGVETGYSRRYLRGDVFADTAFIRGTLESPESQVRKSWGAWESGFQMAIGAVTAGVQYYWIDGNNDKSFIRGLTSGQLVIGLAVAGDVVSGVLSQ